MSRVPPDLQRLLDWAYEAQTWELRAHRLEYIVSRLLIELDLEKSSAEHYYFAFDLMLKQRAKDKFRDL